MPRARGRLGASGLLAAGALALGACGERGSPDTHRGSFVVLSRPAAGPPPPDRALWETPQSDAALEAGRRVWIGTCIECHSTGLGGAPLIGNASLWAPRIAQGVDVLVEHAIGGFFGDVGEMPARGGNPDLSDEQVRAAVIFMASRAGDL
jgi:cytochrome c5